MVACVATAKPMVPKHRDKNQDRTKSNSRKLRFAISQILRVVSFRCPEQDFRFLELSVLQFYRFLEAKRGALKY